MNSLSAEFLDFDATIEQFAFISQQNALENATDQARLGRYANALKQLDGIEFTVPRLAEDCLLLKAKIAAQQGHLDEARGFFARILQSNPTHVGASSGLVATSKLSNNSWLIYLTSSIAKLVGLIVLVVILAVLADNNLKREIRSMSTYFSNEIESVTIDLGKLTAKTSTLEEKHEQNLELAIEHRESLHEALTAKLDDIAADIESKITQKEIIPSNVLPKNPFIEPREYRSVLFKSKVLLELEGVKATLISWDSELRNYSQNANYAELNRLIDELESFYKLVESSKITTPDEMDLDQTENVSEY